MPSMYIVFDIGATKMRIASSENAKDLLVSKIVPTPEKFDDAMLVFRNTIRELSGGEEIEAVAGGVVGPLDKERTIILNPPNLKEWHGAPIKSELERICKAEVFIENDTAIVGLGEAVVGAGKGQKIVAYVTVSTGVNGVKIVDGQIAPSAMGFEIGRQIVNFDGERFCPSCDEPGYLESYISGSNIERKYGKKPFEVADPVLWEETSKLLAVGLNNVTVFWSPEIIVLGGAMILGNPAIPIERIEFHLDQLLKIFPEHPKLKKAALGDIGGLYGGLAFLGQNIG